VVAFAYSYSYAMVTNPVAASFYKMAAMVVSTLGCDITNSVVNNSYKMGISRKKIHDAALSQS